MASVEGGQAERPRRPAAGAGSGLVSPAHLRRFGELVLPLPLPLRLFHLLWSETKASLPLRPCFEVRWRGCRDDPSARGALRLDPTPAAGRRGLSVWPPSTLALSLPAVSEGTRRDRPRLSSGPDPLSPAGSAGEMPGLGPDLHAQASERAAAGLPSRLPADTYRRRRGSEGRFPRNKGSTEWKATLASAVTPAPDPQAAPRFRGEDGATARAPFLTGSFACGGVHRLAYAPSPSRPAMPVPAQFQGFPCRSPSAPSLRSTTP